MRALLPLLLLVASVGVPACASPFEDDASSADAVSEQDASGALDLHPLDIWAQPLEKSTLTVSVDGRAITPESIGTPGRLRILLGEPRTYAVRLAAPEHVPLDLTIVYDGSKITVRDPSVAPDGGRAGVSIADGKKALRTRTVDGHDLYLGLRHKWFSAQGRPARRGNAVKLLMNGEEAWSDVHARMREARSTILASTWWWDSDFELVRDRPMAPASERRKNTILKTLEASPAQKRVLVGQLLGSQSLIGWMTSDSGLRSHVNDPSFQFMREGNDARGKLQFAVAPVLFGDRVKGAGMLDRGSVLEADEPIPSTVPPHEADLTTFLPGVDTASVHQKFSIIDGTTAYIGGMNFRETDWDSSEHEVFDVRRLPLDTTNDVRDAVIERRCPATSTDPYPATCPVPGPGPRKDYILRIDGPAVADAIDVFESRWNHLIEGNTADAAGRTRMDEVDGDREAKGSALVQVTATMPAPYSEHAIAETWFNAVRNAEHFIYIEDQYFRVPMLHEAIAKRMDEKLDLKFIVVTKAVGKLDPGCAQTRDAYAFFAQRYPDRFQYVTLKSYEPLRRNDGPVPIDVHAKMLVVDDVFMSVGSANKNNRGLVYEYELNAAVYDRAFVTAARRRMLKSLMPEAADTDDVAIWYEQIKNTAAENFRRTDAAYRDPQVELVMPSGFFYPLEAPPKSCASPNVGPDAT